MHRPPQPRPPRAPPLAGMRGYGGEHDEDLTQAQAMHAARQLAWSVSTLRDRLRHASTRWVADELRALLREVAVVAVEVRTLVCKSKPFLIY